MSTTPQNIETLRVVLEADDTKLVGLPASINTLLSEVEQRLNVFVSRVNGAAIRATRAIATAVTSAAADIEAGMALIQGTLVSFSASLKGVADVAIAPFAKSLAQIGTFVNATSKYTAGSMVPIAGELKQFAVSFGHVAASLVSPDITTAAQNMGRIGFFANALSRVKFEKFADNAYAVTSTVNDLSNALSVVKVNEDMVRVGTVLTKLGSAINAITKVPVEKLQPLTTAIGNLFSTMAGYASDETMKASMALVRLGSSLKVIEKFDTAKLTALTGPLSALFNSFKGLATEDALKATSALGRLGTSLSSIAKFDTAKIAALSKPIQEFFVSLSGIATEDTLKVVQALSKLTSAMGVVGRVDPARMAKTLSSLRAFMLGVAAIPMTAGTAQVVSTLNQLSAAMTGLRGGAGGVPPVVNNVAGSMSRIPPAASRASGSLNTLSGSVRGLAGSMMSLHGAMSFIRYPLAAIMGFGVAAFAKFDDALTRTLSHMREWPELDTHITTRTILERGVADISSNSITGATELAKALDHLTSSGMNASAAIRGLQISETFAVAANMQAADATQRLVEMQRAMGLSSADAETHFANMTMLGDRFAGMAPMVGSSTKQLMEAFGEKFTTVMEQTGMSLEQGMAIMGAYSIQNVKGAEASDRAARMIRQIGLQVIDNGQHWTNMGIKVRNAYGEYRKISDIINDLTNSLAGMTNEQATARLAGMGLQDRSLAAVMTLKGMGSTMKELEKAAGDTNGVMQRMADMIRGDFMSQMKRLWNNISNVAIAFGSLLAPAIAAVAGGIESLTKAFKDLNPAYQRLIMISGVAYLTIGVLGPVFRALGSVVAFVLTPLRVVVSSLLMIGSIAISASVGMFRLASSFVRLGVSVASTAVAIAASVGGMFASTFAFFANITSRLWMDITAGFRVLTTFFVNFSVMVVEGVFRGIEAIASLGGFFAHVGKALGKAFVSGFEAVVSGIFKLMVSLAFGVVNLALTLGSWFLIITAGLALIMTLGGVVVTAFKMVAVSVGAIWESIKAGMDGFFNRLNDRAVMAGDALVGMWERAKEVTPAYFDKVMGYISNLAGFFWNFAENVGIIWKFLTENWKTLTVDMGNAFAKAVENMAHNIKTLFNFLVEAGRIAFPLIGRLFLIYAGAGLGIIKDLWGALLADMESAFKGFGDRFIENWGKVMVVVGGATLSALGMITAAAARSADERLTMGNMVVERNLLERRLISLREAGVRMQDRPTEANLISRIEKLNRDIEQMKRGPADDIAKLFERKKGEDRPSQLVLEMGRIPERMAMTNAGVGMGLTPAMTQFQRLFTDTFGKDSNKFKPLLDGFEAITDSFPVLNTLLPPNWTKDIGDLIKSFGRKQGEPGDTGLMPTKQSPGFTFKQISLERTMLGGTAAETLDYQQLVVQRNMAKDLARIRASLENTRIREDREAMKVYLTSEYGPEIAAEVVGE